MKGSVLRLTNHTGFLPNGRKYQTETLNTSLRFLPVLIHEFFLGDGEGAEFITERIFILSRRKLFKEGDITAATVKYMYRINSPDTKHTF